VDGGEVDLVQFVAAEGNAMEALEAAEEAFDFVAPAIADTVVGPGPAAVGLGRDDRMVTELSGQSPGGVVFVGAVHDQGRRAASRSESLQQFASAGRVVALTR